MSRRVGALSVIVALVLAGAGARASTPECDWPMYGRDAGHSFRQADGCTIVAPVTASTLRPRWFVPTPDSVTASPAVADGSVYVGDWTGTFYALDAATGAERWRYEIDDTNSPSFGRIVSSAAVVDVHGTTVVIFAGGATLHVLDAATGDERARVCVDPRADPAVRCKGSTADIGIESSPAVVRDGAETHVVVGMDVHNAAKVGRTGVIRFRLDEWALTPLWKFDPEGDVAAMLADGEPRPLTYTTDPSKAGVAGFVVTADPLTYGSGTGHGCAGVWSSPAVDVAGDRVFLGTASCKNSAVTTGERMYGIRFSDGGLVWHESPLQDRGEGIRLDDDYGASPNLLPGGLVGFGGKDGWYHARDRSAGGSGWSRHAGQAGHATTDFAVGGMIGSAATGEVLGQDAIFATTALSTPIDRPFDERGPDPDERLLTEDPGRMLSLHAMRASDGAILWRTPVSRQSYGAASYANGVVFVPSTFDMTVKAFHADTGILLWESPLIGASSSTPVLVGDSMYLGSGTRTTDAEYKQFGASAFESLLGTHPLSPLSGIWGFEVVAP